MANNTLSDFPVLTNLDAASVTHVQKELVDYQVALDTLTEYVTENAEYITLGDKIDGADEKTDPVDADMVGLMDSAASNVLKKFSWANFKAKLKTYFDALYLPIDGWIGSGQTWTRESATSFSEPIDATSKYSIGAPVKWTDSGGVKYGNVASIGSYSGGKTIISLVPNADYSMAASAITSPYFSKTPTPRGFPAYFNFTPVPSSSAGTITTASATSRFNVIGARLFLNFIITITTNGTGSGSVRCTVPTSSNFTYTTVGIGKESGVTGYFCSINAVSGTNYLSCLFSGDTYPGASGAVIRGSIDYYLV